MIAVIADDLTGAAEIAGIAVRNGLRCVISISVPVETDVDVLVLATDCRSRTGSAAAQLIRRVTRELQKLKPAFIFKKTDSLLRGNVGKELLAQMDVSGMKRTLLIPANPRLQRTIRDGVYFAGDLPLHESELADAARKKIKTSAVLDLLGKEFKPISSSVALNANIPPSGFVIGDTFDEADLDNWAERIDAGTIPAGSAGFFNAIVHHHAAATNRLKKIKLNLGAKMIFICGSAFPQSKASVKAAKAAGERVVYMPANFFCPGTDLGQLTQRWKAAIIDALNEQGRVIVAVDKLTCNYSDDVGRHIRSTMATVVRDVIKKTNVDELMIEGGATAAAIIDTLGIEKLIPQQELSPGVIRMKAENGHSIYLTMKPGSYRWPDLIWKQP